MYRYGLIASAILVAGSPLAAQPETKGYTCSFAIGSAFTHDKGRFKRTPASPVTLDIIDIVPATQSATLVSGDRRTTVRVIQAVSALHIIEVAGEGFLNLTTIYGSDSGITSHPAVQARHFGVLGQPIVSNYRGRCTSR